MTEAKHVRDSYTEQVQILTQATMNGFNRLFGGQLMQWVDVVGAVVARRHSGCNVTTAAIDRLTFDGAARPNDTMILRGYMVYAGRTSMEVCVKAYVEALGGERTLVNTAYLVLVALDGLERPTEVPRLIPETEKEIREYEAAEIRYRARRQARGQGV